MLFEQALEGMIKGEYASRNAWDVTGEYVCLLPGMAYVWKILTQPNPNAGNWLPTVADLKADDWKLITNADRNDVIHAV